VGRRGSRVKLQRFYSCVGDLVAASWAPVCGGTRDAGVLRNPECHLQPGPPSVRLGNGSDSSGTEQWSLALPLVTVYNMGGGKKAPCMCRETGAWMGAHGCCRSLPDTQPGGTRRRGASPAAHGARASLSLEGTPKLIECHRPWLPLCKAPQKI